MIIKKLFAALGILLVICIICVGTAILIGLNYARKPLKADADHWPVGMPLAEIHEKVDQVVTEMDFEEKLAQLSGEPQAKGMLKIGSNYFLRDLFPHVYSGKNDRLGIPPFCFSDGPRGVVVGKGNTAFPVAMARAASWDTDLERRVGYAIAKEMRAQGTNYFGGICLNILRHPAWGRAQECYGEDPWLMGEMGLSMTNAIQTHNIMACAKHYALNSVENARFYIDIQVDERSLREVYLPHFKKVVQQGEIASIMSAYNLVRGEYCGHNRHLLTDILREDWGFTGFVSSDWLFGLREGVKGVKAGMDVEMPVQNHYGEELEIALEKGSITEEEIDKMVKRVVETKLRFATREDPMEYNSDLIGHPLHLALAREAAEKSMVLLKNEDVLPFSTEKIKKLAIIGRLANVENTGDKGSSYVRAKYVVTPLQGIGAYVGKDVQILYHDGSDLAQAEALAKEADAVVLIVGFDYQDEGEYVVSNPERKEKATKVTGGGDRTHLRLHIEDERLIQTISPKNPKTVTCYMGGSAITMQNWEQVAPAILFSWYAGSEGGTALARILFGDANPSGKLPFTIPENEDDLPFFAPFIDTLSYGYYHGYTLFDKMGYKVAYPFGFGMSYTQFSYTNLALSQSIVGIEDTLSATIEVKNTGDQVGEEIVQLYIGFQNSAVDRPVKLLRAFSKVSLAAGQSRSIHFEVPVQDMAWYNPDQKRWEVEKMQHEIYIGKSSAKQDLLMDTFTVE